MAPKERDICGFGWIFPMAQRVVGILPDIYIEKTIDGVKSAKDEFLQKAKETYRTLPDWYR